MSSTWREKHRDAYALARTLAADIFKEMKQIDENFPPRWRIFAVRRARKRFGVLADRFEYVQELLEALYRLAQDMELMETIA